MKTKHLLLALLGLSTLSSPLSTLAQGTAFTYQGRLNHNDSPANGSYDLEFSIFSAPAGGDEVGKLLRIFLASYFWPQCRRKVSGTLPALPSYFVAE